MRITVKFEKGEPVRYLSHLDMQRLLQRAFRRAKIPLAYSLGFNPHPQLSFATALSVGTISRAEWLDVKLTSKMDANEFIERVNAVLPNGVKITEAYPTEENAPTLSTLMYAVEYKAELMLETPMESDRFNELIEKFLSRPIFVWKKTKSGDKEVDIRPMVFQMKMEEAESNTDYIIRLIGRMDVAGSLNADLLLDAFLRFIGQSADKRIERLAIYSDKDCVLPHADF